MVEGIKSISDIIESRKYHVYICNDSVEDFIATTYITLYKESVASSDVIVTRELIILKDDDTEPAIIYNLRSFEELSYMEVLPRDKSLKVISLLDMHRNIKKELE